MLLAGFLQLFEARLPGLALGLQFDQFFFGEGSPDPAGEPINGHGGVCRHLFDILAGPGHSRDAQGTRQDGAVRGGPAGDGDQSEDFLPVEGRRLSGGQFGSEKDRWFFEWRHRNFGFSRQGIQNLVPQAGDVGGALAQVNILQILK